MKENIYEINKIQNSPKIKVVETNNALKLNNNSNISTLENNKKPLTFRLRHFPFFYCINNIKINYFISSLIIIIVIVIIFIVCFLFFRKGINSNNITSISKNEYIISKDDNINNNLNNNINDKSEYIDKSNEYILTSIQNDYRKYNNTNDIEENEIERVSDTMSVSNEIKDNIDNSCEKTSIEYEVNNTFNNNLLNEVYHIKVENGYTYCTIYIHFTSSTKYRYFFSYEVRSICDEVFIFIIKEVVSDLDKIDHATFHQTINKGIQFIFKKTPKNIYVIEKGLSQINYTKIDNI